MKILHIIPNLRKGGAERLVIDIVTELMKNSDNEVKLVIFENEISYNIDFIKENIVVIPSEVNLSIWKRNKFKINELQNFISEFQPDIIHSHLFQAEIISRSCTFKTAKWFSHGHDNMKQLSKITLFSKTGIIQNFEKNYLFKRYKKNGGTTFITISKHTQNYFQEIQTTFPVILLYNAINVNRFLKPIDNQSTIYDGTIKLINVGSFVGKKNQKLLIDIVAHLNKNGISATAVFLGDGHLLAKVKEKANLLNVLNYCQFPGNVENVEEYLWQSNVYVHTAVYEPLGLVLLEAMAAGLPVVSLDGGGNKDILQNGKNGYIIEQQNIEEFSNRILEVVNNKEIEHFCVNFSKKFDISSYVVELLKYYKA